jgi:CDP-paratose 2-epimerase
LKILISGICGFAGSTLARSLAESGHQVCGFDNFIRPGSETNRAGLKEGGIRVFHGDARSASDLEALPACDWVVDAAANASVLAGVDGLSSSRQLVEHNLGGTLNLLEFARKHRAGFVLLSTSRVYGIAPLAGLALEVENHAYRPSRGGGNAIPGLGLNGISEAFSTVAPVSLYGATKLASETMALEYGETFDLPVFVNRCGVLAGAGQFGRPDQGIFAYWIHSWFGRRPLKYIGFDGLGHQVRDCLHPADLIPLLAAQFKAPKLDSGDRVVNVGGGIASATSLRQLSDWCARQFGPHAVASDPKPRTFDIPWLVLDTAKAARVWGWKPRTVAASILEEIAAHARTRPDWIDVSAP